MVHSQGCWCAQVAAQQQAATQASLRALTLAMTQLRQGQQLLERDMVACLRVQTELQVALRAAAESPGES